MCWFIYVYVQHVDYESKGCLTLNIFVLIIVFVFIEHVDSEFGGVRLSTILI